MVKIEKSAPKCLTNLTNIEIDGGCGTQNEMPYWRLLAQKKEILNEGCTVIKSDILSVLIRQSEKMLGGGGNNISIRDTTSYLYIDVYMYINIKERERERERQRET